MLQLGCGFLVLVSLGVGWICYNVNTLELQRHSTSETIETIRTDLFVNDTQKIAKRATKSRIFIAGIGHSATSYVQQFIGDVLYRKHGVFYLFEATHPQTIEYQLSFYNITTDKNNVQTRRQLISYYFECNFPKMNYQRAFMHFQQMKPMNKWHRNQHVNGHMLTQKCLSSKYLIYKEIHMPQYSQYILQLWQQFPQLKIIAMVRNPISHIPSARRMVRRPPSLDKSISNVCDKQLHQIQYGMNHSYDTYGVQRFFVFKLEEFFHNISHELNTSVKYYYQNVLDIPWNTSEETYNLQKLNVAYGKMLKHLWGFNHRLPLRKGQTLNANEKQRIVDDCRDFNERFGY